MNGRAPGTELLCYRERHARARARRRAHARTRVAFPALPAPIDRLPQKRGDWFGGIAGSSALHASIVIVALVFPSRGVTARVQQPIAVDFVPSPAREEPKPVEPEPVKPVARRPVVRKVDAPSTPPPDPVATPSVEPPAEQPRRIVGLSMESTVTSADAPAFAVGNTRMGETADVAEAPEDAKPLADELVPPRRLSAPEPDYPQGLRAQGIEGDVLVEAQIDAEGHVTEVVIAKGSGYAEFDAAAVETARRGVYAAARINGAPVAQSVRFAVRFRLRKGVGR